jgi:hypothetical protein
MPGSLILLEGVLCSVLAEILVCPRFCILPAEAGPFVVVRRIAVMKTIHIMSVKMQL